MRDDMVDTLTTATPAVCSQALPIGSSFAIDWPATYDDMRASLDRKLFVTNPGVLKMLDLWQRFAAAWSTPCMCATVPLRAAARVVADTHSTRAGRSQVLVRAGV